MDAIDSLLRRCQAGESAALAELIRLYQLRVYQLALRVCGDPALAEEAATDTFVKIWSRCGQWRGKFSGSTWIYRVATRTILDLQRSRRRWWRRWGRSVEHANPAQPVDPAQIAGMNEQRQRDSAEINAAIAELDEEDRALIHLFYFDSRSLADIAEILDVGRDALKMRLKRVRDRLRKRLRGSNEPA